MKRSIVTGIILGCGWFISVFLWIYGNLKMNGDTSNIRLQAFGFLGIILFGISITIYCSIMVFNKYKKIKKRKK
jgi:hypothetical protein